jgi:hypothetical protein
MAQSGRIAGIIEIDDFKNFPMGKAALISNLPYVKFCFVVIFAEVKSLSKYFS